MKKLVDKISKEKRSKIMSAIRSTDTTPELKLRKALFAKGHRYRIHYGESKIDIAFPSKKIAVFVDGCFWHGCPLHSHVPQSNVEYWRPKLQRNKDRDLAVNACLQNNGWLVLRFWEHELENMPAVIKKIETESTSANGELL